MYDEPVRMKPTFYINDSDFPELRDMELGEEYEVIMKIRPTNLNQSVRGNQVSAEITILDIQMPPEMSDDINSMDDEEFLNYGKKKKRKAFSK